MALQRAPRAHTQAAGGGDRWGLGEIVRKEARVSRLTGDLGDDLIATPGRRLCGVALTRDTLLPELQGRVVHRRANVQLCQRGHAAKLCGNASATQGIGAHLPGHVGRAVRARCQHTACHSGGSNAKTAGMLWARTSLRVE